MKKKTFLLSVFAASLMGAGVAIGSYHLLSDSKQANTFVRNEIKPNYSFANNQAPSAAFDFTYAAEVSTPAVVHITTYQEVNATGRGRQDMNEFFKEFFGEGNSRRNSQPDDAVPEQRKAGSGSGVILRENGYIVTNNHVIKGADKIEVVLNDKRRYIAELVGTDPTTDLAVLKVEENSLPFIKFGDSESLKIGEWVVAVGNPFDLTSTVTAGIVSAKARNINILRDKENLAIESFIQTDAAVNPGNSGGALVNLNGELIGVNTAIATPTGTFAGYSFAVPSTLVNKVVEDLIEYGEVQRALLGIAIADITAELSEEKDLGEIEGVYVAGVRENSAAGEAGIEEGDVILKINDQRVNSSSELQEAVALYRPGDEIEIQFKRDGKVKNASSTLRNRLGNTSIVKKNDKSVVSIFNSNVREITAAEKEELGISNGVKVVAVGDGKLREAGVKEGFVITKVDKKQVVDPGSMVEYLSQRDGAILLEGLYEKNERAYYALGW